MSAPNTWHLDMDLVLGMLPRSLESKKLLQYLQSGRIEMTDLIYVPARGRWMAEVLMKLVFAHILLDYDISVPGELKHPLPERWSFEEPCFPRDARILLLPRPKGQDS